MNLPRMELIDAIYRRNSYVSSGHEAYFIPIMNNSMLDETPLHGKWFQVSMKTARFKFNQR